MHENTVIENLRTEHEQVFALIKSLRNLSWKLASAGSLNANALEVLSELPHHLSFFVEELHHGKEEEILFPALFQHSDQLKHGGPQCILFMGLRIQHDLVGKIMTAARNQTGPMVTQPARAPIRTMVECQSPLTIPIEEHLAGMTCVQNIKTQLENLQKNPQRDRSQLIEWFRRYCDLLESHARKENECLFVMAQDVLPEELNKELGKACYRFENDLGQERISSTLQYFEKLKGIAE